ncbi:DUF2267 domain-containing protein [Pseudonocardia bannensis]|uniref:DUF2267 domain-containing protein n=1 Tax=Pseudonocardia bannensis TaxID=630973 RepID=A0A848DJ19_9PSEU|nr:DUF2267 domain-containing protein [Pseudonocardia bannensis]NMH92697.1 DUF2267 domain-containing protein [Pseudonocardia bannensis]
MLYYPDFIESVQQLGDVSPQDAERMTCATLQMLARRISRGEAEDLVARLPGRLRPCLEHEGPVEKFGLDEFLRRIAQQVGVDRPTTQRVARAVFATLWRAVGSKEFNDMRSQLPKEFRRWLDEAVAAAPAPPVADEHPPARLSLEEFLDRIAERGVDRDLALPVAEAVLEILAARITGGQVMDLIPLVPRELRPALRRGIDRSRGAGMRMPLEDFLSEIAERTDGDMDLAHRYAQAVVAALHDAVGDKEFSDMVAQLPAAYRDALIPEYA